ncbi:hypothetical protein Leryth_004131 [Lithospermum erythrorhizon]|nr:hypothetical protein Leryth_004131 [Lithospermum erythrorhizon]
MERRGLLLCVSGAPLFEDELCSLTEVADTNRVALINICKFFSIAKLLKLRDLVECSFINLEKNESSLSSSFAGVSNSATLPVSITNENPQMLLLHLEQEYRFSLTRLYQGRKAWDILIVTVRRRLRITRSVYYVRMLKLTSQISLSEYLPKGSRFPLTVPSNIVGS